MPKMIVLKSGWKYDSRNMSKGDIISVKSKDVRLLKALSRVGDFSPSSSAVEHVVEVKSSVPTVTQPSPLPSTFPPTPPSIPEVKPEHTSYEPGVTKKDDESDGHMFDEEMYHDHDIKQTQEYSTMLRKRATDLGIRVDGRWSDARVQREIDDYNKNKYQRMDLRAEE